MRASRPSSTTSRALLGAGPATLARTIHLPLARPALWGAALLVFVDCLKELPATLLLRPLNVETLSTYIYQFATRGNFEEGSLAALLIVVVGILPVMLISRHADARIGAEAAGRRLGARRSGFAYRPEVDAQADHGHVVTEGGGVGPPVVPVGDSCRGRSGGIRPAPTSSRLNIFSMPPPATQPVAVLSNWALALPPMRNQPALKLAKATPPVA